MSKTLKFISILLFSVLITACIASARKTPEAGLPDYLSGYGVREGFGFITRGTGVNAGKLYDGDRVFRFAGVNMAELIQAWNGGKHFTTAFEMKDAIATVSQMGGRVVRCHTLGVLGSAEDNAKASHYEGPGKYNEEG